MSENEYKLHFDQGDLIECTKIDSTEYEHGEGLVEFAPGARAWIQRIEWVDLGEDEAFVNAVLKVSPKIWITSTIYAPYWKLIARDQIDSNGNIVGESEGK